MAQLTPTGRVLPHELSDRFKWDEWTQASWHECRRNESRTGGRMVKVMISYAEEAMAGGGAPQ